MTITIHKLYQAAFLITLASSSVYAGTATTPLPDLAEMKEIATEAYIYGLPIVMNYGVMYEYSIDRQSKQFKAPLNVIKNMPRVYTYKDTSVITPNSDTPYSLMMMDLRREPLVLSVPDIENNRYYSLMLSDSNTYNYGYIGSRATGNDAGNYLVVGPGWKGEIPQGIKKVFHSSTWFSAAVYRTQLFNAKDMQNVARIQKGYKVTPLSVYLNQPPPPAAPEVKFPKIDKALAEKDFFDYLAFMLQFAPAASNEEAIRDKLARIGVIPGEIFNFKSLPLLHKAALLDGLKKGKDEVRQGVANAGKNINGWRVSGAGGNDAYYNGDWLLRANVAQAGIYANDADEAMYPFTRTDSRGMPIDTSKHSYTLTFAKDQFPPVNGFWSVTMYDSKTQLLIENPINRYLINSPMLPGMKLNTDGSLSIYIQNKSPGKDKESNWLPAPNGEVYLVMRLYWPKKTSPSILPPGDGTWDPPPVTS